MGHLDKGTWTTVSIDASAEDGAFKRAQSQFRNWVTPDGQPGPTGKGGFTPDSGRYHLYVSYACPWAHRTLIFRQLKDLADHVSISVVHPDMLDRGWTFRTDDHGAEGDHLFGSSFLHEIYTRADPFYSGRVTVPILWDKQQHTIVSNESAEIIRMFNSAFNDLTGNRSDFRPEPLQDEIEEVNARIYDTLNNGVYKSGFASTQDAYEAAVYPLFDTLDWLEDRLSRQRYLMGNQVTEADWRLFPTLIRFDPVYHLHFKCNRRRISDCPALWAYTRELYQWPGVADTVNMDHIVRHYHYSHDSINPHRIIPINPVLDLSEPHGRDQRDVA